MLKSILIAAVLLSALGVTAQDLKKSMETNYKAFTAALEAKDAVGFKNTVSVSAYMKMKNAMVSSKNAFPETFFESAADYALNFTTLRFLKASENGPTGNLIYYDNDEENVVLIKFMKEAGTWKFLEMEFYGTVAIANQMKNNDLSFLNVQKFIPDGVIPTTSQEVKSIDYMGMITISGEYKISISVNGIEQERTNGGSKSGLLIGGVKRGKNTIAITLTPLKDVKGSDLSVSVSAIIEEKQKEVFVLKLTEPTTTISKEFVVQ